MSTLAETPLPTAGPEQTLNIDKTHEPDSEDSWDCDEREQEQPGGERVGQDAENKQALSDESLENNDAVPDTDTLCLLAKLEQLNKQNELDGKSLGGSRRSGEDSSSNQAASMTDKNDNSNGSRKGSQIRSSPASQQQSTMDEDLIDEAMLDLWAVWGDLVKNWHAEVKKRPQYIRQLCRRGIPTHFRTIGWQLLAGAEAKDVHEKYAEILRRPSAYEKVIKRDVTRTYPEVDFFKDGARGQQSLLNVIKAYSVYDDEVGYCQGSAFIVGMLLLQMPEEEAFAVLLRLMDEYRLREIYKPAMTELGLAMFQLECIVQEQLADLYDHFNNCGFDTSMYASSWFLTLFTTQLPMELACRIMDVFLSEGFEIIFRVAIAILQSCRFDLLQLDMEGMLKFFQREVPARFGDDHELLMTTAYKVVINQKKMKRLEKEYLTKRTKEQEEAVELRRLRTECRLLRQRVEYLERESEALAGRLIKGQVNLAQEAENCMSITHEFHKLREMNNDANRKLEEAYETIRELSTKRTTSLTESGAQADDDSMVEHIHSLQQRLIETAAREADNEQCIRDLKHRVAELETTNKRLRETPPDHGVAALQEELIAVKMREAEANLSLKEMRQRLAELEKDWVQYLKSRTESTSSGTSDVATTHSNCADGSDASTDANGAPSTSNESHSDTTLSNGDDSCVRGRPAHDTIEENGQAVSDNGAPGPCLSDDDSHMKSAPHTPAAGTHSNPASHRFSFVDTILQTSKRSFSASLGATGLTGRNADKQANAEQAANMKELEDQLMGIRIRETDTLAELKEMRQRVMQLETQNQVCTNQIRRKDEEYRQLRDDYDKALGASGTAERRAKEAAANVIEADSKLKEFQLLARHREAELTQMVDALREQLAESDSRRHEKFLEKQFGHSSNSDVPGGLRRTSSRESTSTTSGNYQGSSGGSVGHNGPVDPMTMSVDRLSVASEASADFNNYVDEMQLKIPSDLSIHNAVAQSLGANDDSGVGLGASLNAALFQAAAAGNSTTEQPGEQLNDTVGKSDEDTDTPDKYGGN